MTHSKIRTKHFLRNWLSSEAIQILERKKNQEVTHRAQQLVRTDLSSTKIIWKSPEWGCSVIFWRGVLKQIRRSRVSVHAWHSCWEIVCMIDWLGDWWVNRIYLRKLNRHVHTGASVLAVHITHSRRLSVLPRLTSRIRFLQKFQWLA